jgi:FKBP-type peptidyl-prolyl cis-trans isomerase
MNGMTAALLLGLTPTSANAAVRTKEELVKIGTQTPAGDGDANFIELPNGVKIKEYRVGTGDEIVKENSQVMIQATGRLLNFNGFVFYSTKNNNPDGFGALPLTINLGKGEALPGLEAGIVGMRKGGIRRILIPAGLAYSNFRNLEPRPMSANDQRALDSVVKNPNMDATVLFDVSLERFK